MDLRTEVIEAIALKLDNLEEVNRLYAVIPKKSEKLVYEQGYYSGFRAGINWVVNLLGEFERVWKEREGIKDKEIRLEEEAMKESEG